MSQVSYSADELAELVIADPKAFINALLNAAGYRSGDFNALKSMAHLEVVDGFYGFRLILVHSEGGHEGEGEYVERIFKVIRDGKYTAELQHHNGEDGEVIAHLRFTGYYQSYSGTEWNDAVEIVYPQEVLVTQYFNGEQIRKFAESLTATGDVSSVEDVSVPVSMLDLAKTDPYQCAKQLIAELGCPVDEYDGKTFQDLFILEVYSEGGYEGDGEHKQKVFAVIQNVSCAVLFHFMVTGKYNSSDSNLWHTDAFSIVRPVQVQVTQYQPVQSAK